MLIRLLQSYQIGPSSPSKASGASGEMMLMTRIADTIETKDISSLRGPLASIDTFFYNVDFSIFILNSIPNSMRLDKIHMHPAQKSTFTTE
jgi:hypothetical protein